MWNVKKSELNNNQKKYLRDYSIRSVIPMNFKQDLESKNKLQDKLNL